MATTNSLNIKATGVVSYNSTTGIFSESPITQFNTLVGGASNAITSIAPSTAGFVLTSNGGSANPTFQSPAAPTTFAWVQVASGTQAVSPATGYVTDNATQVTYTLPATPSFGDGFVITGGVSGAATAPWTLAQNANQQIKFGNSATTVGVTGSLTATLQYDTVELLCIVAGASAVWVVIESVGSITIA